jgi:hypothetical protein
VSAEPPALDLSVVLVNWNSLDLTSAALTSIETQTSGISYELFVVDNGTTLDDGVAELPRRHPWITLIANQNNLGFSWRRVRRSCTPSPTARNWPGCSGWRDDFPGRRGASDGGVGPARGSPSSKRAVGHRGAQEPAAVVAIGQDPDRSACPIDPQALWIPPSPRLRRAGLPSASSSV